MDRLVDAYADWPAARQLPECVLIERAELNAALETAGIDSPLPEWELQVAEDRRALECVGGNEEISVALYVADFGTSDVFDQVVGAAFPEGVDEQTLNESIGPTVGSCEGSS